MVKGREKGRRPPNLFRGRAPISATAEVHAPSRSTAGGTPDILCLSQNSIKIIQIASEEVLTVEMKKTIRGRVLRDPNEFTFKRGIRYQICRRPWWNILFVLKVKNLKKFLSLLEWRIYFGDDAIINHIFNPLTAVPLCWTTHAYST